MASNINPTNIDILYPIAGQDNDTQGFRTNFANILGNFATAKAEITALQEVVATVPHIAQSVPASATAIGTTGQIYWDEDYLYVCVSTNNWVRAALSAW